VLYFLREQAKADLALIWRYTAKHWGTHQADKYYQAFIASFEELAQNPELGKIRYEIKPGYRSFPQGSHVIFYTIQNSYVEIIGLPHQREDIENHF
jgi:toxin ParE1/3/4